MFSQKLFDYQSKRHCPKTIGAKSPLQETALSTSTCYSVFDKVQVNNPFTLVIIDYIIHPFLKKKYWDVREKDVLEEHSQSPFRQKCLEIYKHDALSNACVKR